MKPNPVIAFIIDYCHRHAHPVNALLHIIGVPAACAGIYFLFCGKLSLAVSLVVAGYFLQYLGHEAQGNEVGEITLIKSILKKRSANAASASDNATKAIDEVSARASASDNAVTAFDEASARALAPADNALGASENRVQRNEVPRPQPTERLVNEAPIK
jgi:Protein of unknown function (DUF962)